MNQRKKVQQVQRIGYPAVMLEEAARESGTVKVVWPWETT